jgi:hypothetical protein
MDDEVMAWTLANFPPEKLASNELVTDCDTPLEREQMQQVLLKTMVRKGDGKKTKKDLEQSIKALSVELANLKKSTAHELESMHSLNLSIKETMLKSLAHITELLQAQGRMIQEQGTGYVAL